MHIGDILEKKGGDVVTIPVSDSIAEATSLLARHRIGVLVVMADTDRPVGILSERDIVRGLERHGVEIASLRVGDLMTARPVVCHPDDTAATIMRLMTTGRFRHVPVVGDRGLCGIISIGDLVKQRVEDLECEAEELRAYVLGSNWSVAPGSRHLAL